MTRLSPQQQAFVWIGTTLLIIVAATTVYLTFVKTQLDKNTTSIQDALLTMALNTQQQQNYSTQSKQIATIQNQTEQLNQSFFDRTKAIVFVDYFENLASQNSVTQDLKLEEPSRTSTNTQSTFTVEEKNYTANLKGTTVNLLRFFSALETNPAYILTNTVSLNRNEDGTTTLNLAGTIPWQ